MESTDAFWEMKRHGETLEDELPEIAGIHMPRNSANGFVTSFFAVIFGFAMIWHIWWMAIVGFFGLFATFLVLAWRGDDHENVPSEEIARNEHQGATGATT